MLCRVMKLTLHKYGGLAAGIRRPPTIVDDRSMPEAAAQQLHDLLACARSAALAAPGATKAMPDAMSYSIEVEDNGQTVKLTASDTNMPAAFAELLDWIDAQK